MGGPASSQLTTGTVAPGEEIDVSVSLTAPTAPDTYRGDWKLRNGGGIVFGVGAGADKSFWVKVKVVVKGTATPTPTQTPDVTVGFDFVDKGPDAEWRNASDSIPWGDPVDDSPGVAVALDDVELEDGKTYDKGLATYPQRIDDGMISGLYPAYTIQDGDHLKAVLGLRQNCDKGKVKYQLKYVEGGGETGIGEWIVSCDGNVVNVDIDLSAMDGVTVQFKLYVYAEGTSNDDKAVWANPRIER
jgi:hypothetical protein